MASSPLERMRQRARDVRTRAAIRRWNYRQRNLAAGAWFHLRRALADARAAYTISDDDARQLVAEGFSPEPCGRRVAPEKTILFVDEARLFRVGSRRPIRVALGADFLTATAVALVAFDDRRSTST